jgi:hypothetical protein
VETYAIALDLFGYLVKGVHWSIGTDQSRPLEALHGCQHDPYQLSRRFSAQLLSWSRIECCHDASSGNVNERT